MCPQPDLAWYWQDSLRCALPMQSNFYLRLFSSIRIFPDLQSGSSIGRLRPPQSQGPTGHNLCC
jgi:hypothetical protein